MLVIWWEQTTHWKSPWCWERCWESLRCWGQKEKRASEGEMAGQHHWCNEYELGQIPEMVRNREAWRAAVHGFAESDTTVTEQQQQSLETGNITFFGRRVYQGKDLRRGVFRKRNSSWTICECVLNHVQLCGPPGSSVHGISQARILEWIAISSSRRSSRPRSQNCISHVSCTGRQVLYHRATWGGPS